MGRMGGFRHATSNGPEHRPAAEPCGGSPGWCGAGGAGGAGERGREHLADRRHLAPDGFTWTEQETNETSAPYGERPGGMITYTRGGHVVLFLTGEGRRAPAAPALTEAERAELFRTIIGAYTGTYRVEGDKVISRVETAWTPAWNGTEQVRTFTVEGDRLTIRTVPLRSVDTGRMIVAVLTFARVE
jgi:hypothetical protein